MSQSGPIGVAAQSAAARARSGVAADRAAAPDVPDAPGAAGARPGGSATRGPWPGWRGPRGHLGRVRLRLGIRFHIFLAAALLVALALAIGIYSSRLADQARAAGAEQARTLEVAVLAARSAFDSAGELGRYLEELARAEREDLRHTEIDEIRARLVVIRQDLAEVATGLGRLAAPGGLGGAAAAPATGVLAARLLRPARAADLVQSAAGRLAEAVSRRLEARVAVRQRAERLAVAQGRHFDACTRVEVTMRALASRALALDLGRAASDGRLQRRIDELLEREMSWVATAQDLRTDSRGLVALAERALTAAEPGQLEELQRTLSLFAKRLDIYRRLPALAATAPLEAATAEYRAAVESAPALADLRRAELAAEGAVAAASAAGMEASEGLTASIYDLTQGLAEEGRRSLGERQQAALGTQRLLQISALGAGFLVLGLVGYYLSSRVIRPLERLTEAMYRSSRRLALGQGAAHPIAPETLAGADARRDEVGDMTEALRALHGTLVERERALLEHQERLHHLAHHDPLTGLPNRTLLTDCIERTMVRARGAGRLLAVGLLDLDGFKSINDRLGHAAGDAVLIALARRLRGVLRECDTLARLGGDEIALLLPDLDTDAQCAAAMARVLDCVSAPCDLGGGTEVQVSASIGYTLFPDDPGPGDVLVRHADQAMYAAKREGKNRVRRYDSDQDRMEEVRLRAHERIGQALAARELALYYQPIVDLSRGLVVGAEALLRWHHPELGTLTPAELLRAVAGSELGVRIGRWVLGEALRESRRWPARERALVVGVNVAAEHLRGDVLADEVERYLGADAQQCGGDGTTLSRPLLQLEIVENAALEDLAQAGRVLARCRGLGALVALDDFGTGYSSLTHVRELPVDTLKIDRSFVAGMLDNPEDRLIVAAVIALARALGREVVAEGVETQAQSQALLELGCHLVQGFGIARPMPADRLVPWILQWEREWGGGSPGLAAGGARASGLSAVQG